MFASPTRLTHDRASAVGLTGAKLIIFPKIQKKKEPDYKPGYVGAAVIAEANRRARFVIYLNGVLPRAL